jgi:hypothetical protein
MPTRRFRCHSATRYFRRRLTPLADLYGRSLPLSIEKHSGYSVTVTRHAIDTRPDAEEETSLLAVLRERLENELERLQQIETLNEKQVVSIKRWIAEPATGFKDVATEEGVRRQAIHSRLRVILRRWPPFARAWVLKQAFIRNNVPPSAAVRAAARRKP